MALPVFGHICEWLGSLDLPCQKLNVKRGSKLDGSALCVLSEAG